MRHLLVAAAASALALLTVRCGSSPAGTGAVAPPADAGGGSSPDAGPTADGGGSPIDAGGAPGADGGGDIDAGGDVDAGGAPGADGGGGTAASECDGLMPGPGAKFIWITPPSSACGTAATSDYAGNIALGARGPGPDTTWATYDPQGNQLGSFGSLGRVIPRDSGFQHVGFGDTGLDVPGWKVWARAPDGTQSSSYPVGSDVCGASIYPAATGGSIVVSICGSVRGTTGVFRFDDAGTRLYRQNVDAYPFVGPAEGDANGAILLVARGDSVAGFQSTEMLGRWLNPDGTFMTDWMVLTNDDNSPMWLRALIGGGIAVRQSEQWRMLVPTGRGPDQPPEWLASRAGTDLQVVRGNKGYAFTTTSGEQVEVVTPSGKSCGKFQAGGSHVQIGGDGTVIALSGTCKRTVWPRLLGVR
jgi:hypothetical protein